MQALPKSMQSLSIQGYYRAWLGSRMSSLAHKALDYILNIWTCPYVMAIFPFFFFSKLSLRGKKQKKKGDLNVGGLNAGGQISLIVFL